MITNTESRKDILRAIFIRKGKETDRTKVFENLAAEIRTKLLARAALLTCELPVVASVLNQDRWVLITTTRIVAVERDQTTNVDLNLLRDATVDLLADVRQGNRSKDELSILRLSLEGGKEQLIQVESGAPHIGIWNVLKHAAGQNQRGKFGLEKGIITAHPDEKS